MQGLLEKHKEYQKIIEDAWENRDGDLWYIQDEIIRIFELLDNGRIRVAEKIDGSWQINDWVKKAVLLSFKIYSTLLIPGGVSNSNWYDKFPTKFKGWGDEMFKPAGFRATPGSYVRRSAFIAKNVVLMPSFVNIAAYIDEGTLIDSWASVGSCAQIGKNCHISGGVGIGGVLEPVQAKPVIIEDDCFIGARSEIVDGVIVEQGAVLGMGVYIGSSTKIVYRETGEVSYGRVPAYSVVVPGSIPSKNNTNIYAAIIVKKVDAKTRSKTALNELLRD